jgi:Permuted papain-like amidase enzyme, YaeF/YiiX, C92 family
MKPGDIVFVRSNTLLSKIIRFFDRGAFSHVAIAVSDKQVIEANWYMRTRIVDFHYTDYEIVSLPLTVRQRRVLPIYAARYVGQWYDYLQIVALLFNSRLNNPKHLICSELVFNVLYDIRYLKDESLRDCTPNELYNILNRKE